MVMTIQQAIETIIAAVPNAPFPDTVDTLKVGDPSQNLTGIVVTFLANVEVIEQTVQLGANLIIAHEPLFYNHLDKTDWLSNDPVYQAKRRLIEENGIVIWRFHDYLHSIPPDATVMGLLHELNWEANVSPEGPFLSDIEPMTLLEVGGWIKNRLGLETIRVVGDLTTVCKRVGLLPGFPPAQFQIECLNAADVLIAGEIHEWETSEYARDATHLGKKKGLVVIGHAASEEPGLRRMIPWLEEQLLGVDIRFVPTRNPFHQL